MLASLPPRETWAISDDFPPGSAWVCKTPDENFTLMATATWRRAEPAIRCEEGRDIWMQPLRPVDLDRDYGERRRVMEKIEATVQASVELQEVFRAWWHRLLPPSPFGGAAA